MSSLSNLVAYSDLGLFLAVVGIYVFFAALWLVYSVTEKNARAASETDEKIELLRRQAIGENASSEIEKQLSQRLKSHSLAKSNQLDELRGELETVREIAVLSGQRVRSIRAENEDLKKQIAALNSQLDKHVADFHSSGDEATSEPPVFDHVEDVDDVASHASGDFSPAALALTTDVAAADTSEIPMLRIYDPVVQVSSEELGLTNDQPRVELPVELSGIDQEVKEAAHEHPEKGLVFYKRPDAPDDLTRIWGVGATNQDLLNENGVFYFGQIANWNDANIEKFNNILCFKGRIEREDWVGQAKRLVLAQQFQEKLPKAA